jgi:hypothetical protein
MVLRDSYTAVHSVDYSPVAIERLEAARVESASAQLQGALSYEVADMRALGRHEDGCFGGILDKGALDALLCGDNGEADAAAALREVRAWAPLVPRSRELLFC